VILNGHDGSFGLDFTQSQAAGKIHGYRIHGDASLGTETVRQA
jgi:hypothetical protein